MVTWMPEDYYAQPQTFEQCISEHVLTLYECCRLSQALSLPKFNDDEATAYDTGVESSTMYMTAEKAGKRAGRVVKGQFNPRKFLLWAIENNYDVCDQIRAYVDGSYWNNLPTINFQEAVALASLQTKSVPPVPSEIPALFSTHATGEILQRIISALKDKTIPSLYCGQCPDSELIQREEFVAWLKKEKLLKVSWLKAVHTTKRKGRGRPSAIRQIMGCVERLGIAETRHKDGVASKGWITEAGNIHKIWCEIGPAISFGRVKDVYKETIHIDFIKKYDPKNHREIH